MQIQAKFLEATQWFDPAWYLARCPEAAQAPDPLSHYLECGTRAGIGPNRYIDNLQHSSGEDGNPPERMPDPRVLLRAEMELIKASGLFDADYYLENNPHVAAKGNDPLRHYCQHGWRHLCKPNRDFDPWWYWSCYLDPAQEVINPLVHYALVGRPAGHLRRPPPYKPGPGQMLAPGARARRVCLLAGYDPDGEIDDYVVALVRELSRFADVYYLGDCVMRDGQLERLDPYVAGRWAYRHGLYDFGSWSALVTRHVGWHVIGQYDELLLVNDSNYLLSDLELVFAKMRARACDWWGLQATKGTYRTRYVAANQFGQPIPLRQVQADLIDGWLDDYVYDFHVGSYFLALRTPVISDVGFRRRLTAVCAQRSKHQVIRKYEIGLTQYLIGKQFAFDTFIDDVYPLHPVYTDRHFDLVEKGFPLFKRLCLSSNLYVVPGFADWKGRLRTILPDAPIGMMERNLWRVTDHDKLHRSFSIVKDKSGRIVAPVLLNNKEFQRADAELPKFDHWWAFVVDRFTGALAGNERAVFEAVREDPSIRKIVLTRWRCIDLEGENVVMAPLRSPEGQYNLLRARQVFVAQDDPGESLVFPVSPERHNLINLAWVGMAESEGAVAEGARSTEVPLQLTRDAGLPRLDLVLCDQDRLPADLSAESDRLQALYGDRRLVLLALAPMPMEAVRQVFTDDMVKALHAWLRENKAVLGVRECRAGSAQACYDVLRGPNTLDLSERRFPDIDVIFRHAVVLVADSEDCSAGFVPTGRPAIPFAGGSANAMKGDAASAVAPGNVPSEQVCRNVPQLVARLEAMFATLYPSGLPSTGMKSGVCSASASVRPGNAQQAVERIRRKYSDGGKCTTKMNASRRIALLVPGMHRSGTSALTGTLALLGAQAPKHLIPSSRNNPRGHWESTELMRFHDEVLASEGLQWSDWSQFNPHWMESAVGRSFIARLPQVIVSEFGEAQLLLVKDPRICRLLPLWIKVLSEMDITPRFVLPFRNPLEVAGSLGARNKFGRNQSQLMWLRHVLDAEFETRGHKRVLVEYSDLLADWRMQVRRMSECLELEWPKQINEVGADIDAFLSRELRHHVAPIPDASSQGNEDSLCIDKWVVDAYQALRDLSAPAADAMQDMACLGRLRNELDQSGAIAASVFRESELRSRERVQDLSERLDRIEKRCKALDEQNAQREVEVQKALADRDQKVSKLEIRMAQVKESLAERDRTIGELELRTARTMRALKETERACAAVVVEKEEVQSEGRARLEWSERELALCRRLIGEQEERLHAMRADVGRRLLMKLRRLFRMLPEHGKPEALSDLEVINQSGLFDHAWYLQRYPDVRMHKMDPLVHYMQHGANEGRDPGIGFSTMGYLRRYPDVKASGLNPLLHYVRYGLWEGRIACAREEDVK